MVGVLADPAGQRLLTVETVSDDAMPAELEGLPDWDPGEFEGEYQVNLWDTERLDAPIRELNWHVQARGINVPRWQALRFVPAAAPGRRPRRRRSGRSSPSARTARLWLSRSGAAPW